MVNELEPEKGHADLPLQEYLDTTKVDIEKIKDLVAEMQERVKEIEDKIKALIEKYL